MAPRKRPATSKDVHGLRDEAPPRPASQYDHGLAHIPGRPIPVSDLLSRLQALAKQLKLLDQEDVDRGALVGPAEDLVNPAYLNHKEKGVRAWVACCLADVLRLFAPDAHYKGAQLRDIFNLFVSTIIPALATPSNPYNTQHLYVLGSLAYVKSIVLLTDVPSSSDLILKLFTTCFDVLSSADDDLSKNVEYNMTGVLQCMIDECPALPQQVIDIILAQFMRADLGAHASTAGKKPNSAAATKDAQPTLQRKLGPAYHLAKNLCNTCVEQMARHVSQYFSNVIMDASSLNPDAHPRDQDDDQAAVSEEDMQQLQKAHRLLRELWCSCPGVVQNVVPQVEAELAAENIRLRLMATEAIGDLAAGIGASGPAPPPSLNPAAYPPVKLSDGQGRLPPRTTPQSFAQAHQSTYQQFLGRRNDKSPLIRAAWTTCTGRILATSAGGTGLDQKQEQNMVETLSQMLVDSDEKVRIAAVQAVSLFTFDNVVGKLGLTGGMADQGSIFFNLSARVKDRKPAVRSEAIRLLGRIWAVASGEIAAGRSKVRALLGPAPTKILDAFYLNDSETSHFIDQTLFDSLVPVGYPSNKKKEMVASKGTHVDADLDSDGLDADKIRTERILLLVNDLDERAKPVFFSLITRSKQQGPYMETFLKRCEHFNGGIVVDDQNETQVKQHLNKLREHFAKSFPDPARASEDLKKFATLHDRRAYSLIRFCMARESDYKKVCKSLKELERRMTSLPPQNATIWETLKPLVLKVSNLFINKSHIRPIIEFSQTDENGLGSAAHDMLKHISAHNADIFKTHAEELCRALQAQAPSEYQSVDTSALNALRTCSSFAKKFPGEIPKDRKFFQAIMQFALYGSQPAAGKHAVSIIMAAAEKKQMYAKDLLKLCIEDWQFGSEGFVTRLAAISQLMLLAAEDLEDDIDSVVDIAINQTLNKVRTPVPDDQDDPEWEHEPDEECQAKVWALKILVNRVRHYDDMETVKEAHDRVYRLLNILIAERGECTKAQTTPKAHRSRLHLQAALMHIKLCYNRKFDALLSAKDFNDLALTAQDPIYAVRSAFVKKIKKALGQERLPSRFYGPVFLLAHEPTRRLQEETLTWLRSRAAFFSKARSPPFPNGQRRGFVLEPVLARLLSLLAHHPDFSTTPTDLIDFIPYLLYYLCAVATSQNIGLIYYVAQRVKAVRDAVVDEFSSDETDYSEHLYVLSDLMQAMVRVYEDIHDWSMQSFAGKVSMPTGVFAALPSHDIAQEIATTRYLPAEVADAVDSTVRAQLKTSKKRKSDVDATSTGRSAKRAATATSRKSAALPVRGPPHAKASRRRRSNAADDDEDDESDVHQSSVPVPSSERRRSERRPARARKSYADTRESDDEVEMEGWNAVSQTTEADADAVGDEDMQDEHEDEQQDAAGDDDVHDGSGKENAVRGKATSTARGTRARSAAAESKGQAAKPPAETVSSGRLRRRAKA